MPNLSKFDNKGYYLVLFFLLFQSNISLSNISENNSEKQLYFDAIVFKSEELAKSRIDIYTMVPYQNFEFIRSNDDKYYAEYSIFMNVIDSTGKSIFSEKIPKKIFANDFSTSKGANGDFEYIQKRISLIKGNYKINIRLYDEIAKTEIKKSRGIYAINFDDFNFSLSGLLLVSSIEERNGKYSITPHIDDNISMLKDGFFLFYEMYNKIENQEIDIVYKIFDKQQKLVKSSKKIRKKLKIGTKQDYIRIPFPNTIGMGEFTIQLIALKPSNSSDLSTSDYIAVSERSIKNIYTVGDFVMDNIDIAVEKIKYVASTTEENYILSAKDKAEKLLRFNDFWKKYDPTPTTERNEAFVQYYSRIAYATAKFKNSFDNWDSDRAKIYIILGPPLEVLYQQDRNTNYNYEIWRYSNGKEIIFRSDYSFNNFRIHRPISALSERYKYKSNSD